MTGATKVIPAPPDIPPFTIYAWSGTSRMDADPWYRWLRRILQGATASPPSGRRPSLKPDAVAIASGPDLPRTMRRHACATRQMMHFTDGKR